MKKKFLACGLAACAALVALALPTKKEVQAARPIVAELMADAVAEQKAGKIKTAELGARALALADRAETEAARLLLLQGAVIAYARGGEPARAAEAVRKMRGEIKGITPEYEADMLSRAVKSLPLKDGRLLYGMLDDARRLVRYRREAATLEKSLAAKDDPAKRAQLAERLAALGEWKRALEEIAKLGGDVARAAKFELGEGTMTSAEVAEIWWRQSGMKDADGFTVFQRHAGEWYAKALADGSLTGLKRDLAQKRIDDMGGIKNFRGSGTVASGTRAASGHRESGIPAASEKQSNALYCVIDLSTGPSASRYPVKWLATPPPGGFNTDEYKTSKLVLRRIEPGKFKMDGKYELTLTKPYYMGVFEVTQKQYELVTGGNPSQFKGDMRPVENVSWNMIRGDSSTYNWPSSANVDSSTFMGKLQARTGLKFDLPTEAQWEYACRAGTTSKYNNGGDTVADLKKLGRFLFNQAGRAWEESDADLARHEPDGKGGYSERHTVVGSYLPNAWGLYDMHGNVWEWCLDWKGNLSGGVTDPQGSSSGSDRVRRGGSWNSDTVVHCTSSHRGNNDPSYVNSYVGFRLAIGPDLLKERSGETKVVVPALSEEKLPKETSARPKPLVLDLGGGVKMEMVGCPAGKFWMGINPGEWRDSMARKGHTVEITRPFWIGKFPVLVGEWERLMPKVQLPSGVQREEGDLKLPVQAIYETGARNGVMGLTALSAEEFISKLTSKFRSKLPRGYVFRLPTEAEWEYALKANSTSPTDPYSNSNPSKESVPESFTLMEDSINYWTKRGFTPKCQPESGFYIGPYPLSGNKKPNAWGIYDMGGITAEPMLDSWVCTADEWISLGTGDDRLVNVVRKHPEIRGNGIKDPLLFDVGKSGAVRMRWTRQGFNVKHHPIVSRCAAMYWFGDEKPLKQAGVHVLMLRLVVGPDLLKERGITPPKLGK